MKALNALTQYQLSPADLTLILAMTRTGTLQAAGERMGQDASTVFRAIKRMEQGLGQRLFERSRVGYLPSELAQRLAAHAEQLETLLESARATAQTQPEQAAGTVRISTTDTLLHGLIAPELKQLRALYPRLDYELHTGNELASLTRRDADIALRATRRPPPHLVGKHLGPIHMALFAARSGTIQQFDDVLTGRAEWVAPDDALPEHPSVQWRQKHFPKVAPGYRVSSILTVQELVAQGLGVGVLPVFLAQQRDDLIQLTDRLAECQTELWLLTHTDTRHLRRVSVVFGYLSAQLALR
jgi:DNA-binding transcriptional LysR family regulator